jgi:hypothetical protein
LKREAGESYDKFDAAWDAAEAAGKISAVQVTAYAVSSGTILQSILADIRAAIAWLVNPANRAEELKIIQWIFSILAFFGL